MGGGKGRGRGGRRRSDSGRCGSGYALDSPACLIFLRDDGAIAAVVTHPTTVTTVTNGRSVREGEGLSRAKDRVLVLPPSRVIDRLSRGLVLLLPLLPLRLLHPRRWKLLCVAEACVLCVVRVSLIDLPPVPKALGSELFNNVASGVLALDEEGRSDERRYAVES